MMATQTKPTPSPLVNIEPEFEKLRQIQETHNEVIVNYIQMAVFGSVFLANVTTRFLPLAPYRASTLLLLFIIASFFARVLLFFYLRSNPPYNPARKYLVSTLDIIIYTAAPVLLGIQGAYPWLFLSLFIICNYAMLIALSGLRYSTRVVVYTGVTTLLLHLLIFPALAPPAFSLPVAMVGVLTLGCVAVCTAYSVKSLIRIHRDATAKEQLARFLSPELVEQVMSEPKLLQRSTERRTATVIFTDIRGFTKFSEKMSPEKVVEFLNEFLEEMTVAIMDHKGMLDKYIGDAVMGVFGVPFYADDHALRALRAAVDMRDRLHRLNVKLIQRGLPELSIGIGLHTGELLIGSIGSSRRLDYTVIGDTVNVASRIEGMTRSYPVEILLSDATREAIAGAAILHRIATVQVKNRVEPLTLWSPDPPRDDSEGRAQENAAP
jgi:adenylate cyclase